MNHPLGDLIRPPTPVVSFPKSGRTWLRYAANLEGIEPNFTHAGHPTHLSKIGLPFQGIPGELKDTAVVFLHRNPIDTAVSYYFQILHKDCIPGRKTWRWMNDNNRPTPPLSIDEFVSSDLWGVPLICEYNRAWLDHLDDRSTIITYEDMHRDTIRSFNRFFFAIGHPEVCPLEAARRTTFEAMREVQADLKTGPNYRLRIARLSDPESAKVRRGVVRGYKTYLKRDTIKRLRKIAHTYNFEA